MKLHRQNEWPTLDPHTAQTNSLDMILTYDYLTRVDRTRSPAPGK